MKKNILRGLFIGGLLSLALPVLAVSTTPENRAVNISVASIGGKLDAAALRAVRQIVGYGIASGAVDTFTITSPKPGSVPKEGGVIACAEAGFNANSSKFNAFIQDLRTIKPKVGTVYTVAPVARCSVNEPVVVVDPIMCTMEVKLCPDGSSVGRTGASCQFAPCPETKPSQVIPTACTKEAQLCPDGSVVGRTEPSCKFAPCPTAKKK
jgi:hypothetical protein